MNSHLNFPVGENIADRLKALQTTMIALARGRKECPIGLQRISRDELSTMARECCDALGIKWRSYGANAGSARVNDGRIKAFCRS